MLLLRAKSAGDFASTLCESMKLKNVLTSEESQLIREELNLKTNDSLLTVFDFLRVRQGFASFSSIGSK